MNGFESDWISFNQGFVQVWMVESKMAEFKMVEFKMDAIIKLSQNK